VTLQAGDRAVVAVATATLWESPQSVRPVDAPALAVPPDLRTWVANLTTSDHAAHRDRVLTQLLLGEQVVVDEIVGDWARVAALQQPAPSRDPRGYPGWLPVAHLSAQPLPNGRELIVDATATSLRDAPYGDVVLAGVMLATRLVSTGVSYGGWLEVIVPGRQEPAWVRSADVVALSNRQATAEEILTVAQRLLETPYVWGGLSAYGIDCSGLVHLAHRRFGIVVPRDAKDQYEATKQIALGDEQPGDLYFFAREGSPVHHVGFVAGDRHMVHASEQDKQVLLEPLHGERAATLVGAHQVLV